MFVVDDDLMHSADPCLTLSRRHALKTLSSGFGYLAFASLATRAAQASAASQGGMLAPRASHFPARAKRVIFLCMRGGPSHVDTFDYKPKLSANSGAPGTRPGTKLLGSKWQFAQRRQSGLWISDLFPKVAQHADELCVIRSMQTDLPAHPQAFLQLHTGSFQFVRPSLGAWTLYGLGTENENLPGFVTITPSGASGGAQNYGSSFLPAIYQGTRIGAEGRPIAGAEIRNLRSPLDPAVQRAELDLVQTLNRETLRRDAFNPAAEGVIESYELAFRMQKEMPQVMDLSGESEATQKLYGLDNEATADFGRKCLLARRMAEAGVRFVEISHGDWDQHTNLTSALGANCHSVDQPIAALLTDLKELGLLKDTLVIWGGEFGRTPHAQGNDGRDHNHKAFSLWMAGGGVKGGHAHGETDDYGYEAVIDKVHVHDLLILNDSITPAVGEVTYLSGRILGPNGAPIRGATIEIWQCDANGVYLHSGNTAGHDNQDKNFQGYGRFLTASSGEYLFRTIKPVPYPGRTPHIHAKIRLNGRELLTTQAYINGHPGNKEDMLYNRIRDDKARQSVTVNFVPLADASAGVLAARWDIVLGTTPTDDEHSKHEHTPPERPVPRGFGKGNRPSPSTPKR